jgi:hypothetical protein
LAQNHKNCGSTEKLLELQNKYPDIIQKQEELERFTQNYIKNKKNNKTNSTYIIPVVFHVLHQNGLENISDAQIYDAMRILNEDYAKKNPDTTAIIPDFDTIAANCNIEFRLATKDPYGNCTNGIDRIFSFKTNDADDFSKINFWNRSNYLNIWVVKSIGKSGVAGYAYYPSAVASNYTIDGIIILNNYIGSIGTSNPYNSRALTHEVGHYLNLQHPWGSTNDPGVACGDDGVLDTPETKGFSSCPSNPNLAKICDTNIVENYQNFMDYSYCSKMFTEDQKDRMHAALNSSIGGRNNLWQPANLVLTGTDTINPSYQCAPIADFHAKYQFICQGNAVNFYSDSWNAPISANHWEANGATPSTSNAVNPIFTFNNLYWQHVSLTSHNGNNDSSSITKYNYLFVSPPWTDYYGSFSEGFENSSVFNSQWLCVTNDINLSKWQRTNSAAYTGSNCLFLNAYSDEVITPTAIIHRIGKNDVDAIISPSFDLSTLTAGVLNFKYAYGTRANNSADIKEFLKIYVSTTCGKLWIPIETIQGTSLVTTGLQTNPFFPSQTSEWASKSINLPAIAKNANVRFKIEYTSSYYSNNLFIDDINISGIVGVDEYDAHSTLSVYPNPFDNNTTISYTLTKTENITIKIYDLVGNEIVSILNKNEQQGKHKLNFNKSNLPAGVYLLKLNSSIENITKQIVIQ